MARDQAEAMRKLGINKAHIVGISQGGMIAQYMAIDYPAMVDKLVLVVTMAKPNAMVQTVIGHWMQGLAGENNYKELFIDMSEKAYSEKYLKKFRWLYPILTSVGKPKDFTRFLIQAQACIEHNGYDALEKINCPTLIIGGCQDKIVGPDASQETARKIKRAKLVMYPAYGHGVYEEAKDFNGRVLRFLSKKVKKDKGKDAK